MPKKSIDNLLCADCESQFKVVFDTTETSGYPRFCPFCGGDLADDDDEEDFRDKDED